MSTFVGRFTTTLSRSSFTQNVTVLGGGTAISKGLLVLSAPLLTRLYSPQDMGLLGLFLAYVGFVTAAVALRYDTAIVSPADKCEAAHLVFICFLLVIPSSLAFGVLLYGMIRLGLLGFGNLPVSAALF